MPTVLVTGASTGIGRATALALAPTHTVLAGVRRLQDAPPGTTAVELDITNAEQLAALRDIPQLDALVNNAGIAVTGPLEYLPLDELRRQLEVNAIGQLAVIQAVMAQLRAARAAARRSAPPARTSRRNTGRRAAAPSGRRSRTR